MTDRRYKIILIGDSGVGKSSLVERLIFDKFDTSNRPTIGAAFFSRDFSVKGHIYEAQIWDTAGQERYRSIIRSYFRGSNGCLCVFDVGSRESFDNLSTWIELYQDNISPYVKCPIVIVANKTDVSQWKVSHEEIDDFAEVNGCQVIYTSCKDGKGVEKSFQVLMDEIYESLKKQGDPPITMGVLGDDLVETKSQNNLVSFFSNFC